MITEVRFFDMGGKSGVYFYYYLRLISAKQEDVLQLVKAHKAFNRRINTTIYCKGI